MRCCGPKPAARFGLGPLRRTGQHQPRSPPRVSGGHGKILSAGKAIYLYSIWLMSNGATAPGERTGKPTHLAPRPTSCIRAKAHCECCVQTHGLLLPRRRPAHGPRNAHDAMGRAVNQCLRPRSGTLLAPSCEERSRARRLALAVNRLGTHSGGPLRSGRSDYAPFHLTIGAKLDLGVVRTWWVNEWTSCNRQDATSHIYCVYSTCSP
jgi:hypothetical protein